MDSNVTTNTAYIMHESEVARLERINKRFWILILVLVILLVATNGVWIWYENSYEDIVVTQENADGINNYLGNDGNIINFPNEDFPIESYGK